MESFNSPSSNPEQELAFIRKVIGESRQSFAEDGKPYILWGAIVAAGMLVTYASALMQRDFGIGWLWIALVGVGILYSVTLGVKARKRERERASNYMDRMQGAIWGACGTALGLSILLIMIGYQASPLSIPPIFTCSIVSLILGIAYYLSGFVLEIKWLRNISFAWWAGAIGMYFMHSVHVLLVYAIMILVFQVVPGIILNRKYRQVMRSSTIPVHV